MSWHLLWDYFAEMGLDDLLDCLSLRSLRHHVRHPRLFDSGSDVVRMATDAFGRPDHMKHRYSA